MEEHNCLLISTVETGADAGVSLSTHRIDTIAIKITISR